MSLNVPPIINRNCITNAYPQHHLNATATNPQIVGLDVKFDLNRQEVIFEEYQTCPVQFGNWIVISTAGMFLAT